MTSLRNLLLLMLLAFPVTLLGGGGRGMPVCCAALPYLCDREARVRARYLRVVLLRVYVPGLWLTCHCAHSFCAPPLVPARWDVCRGAAYCRLPSVLLGLFVSFKGGVYSALQIVGDCGCDTLYPASWYLT